VLPNDVGVFEELWLIVRVNFEFLLFIPLNLETIFPLHVFMRISLTMVSALAFSLTINFLMRMCLNFLALPSALSFSLDLHF